MQRSALYLALVLGCGQDPEKSTDDEAPSITGNIRLDEWSGTAQVEMTRAFAYEADGSLVAFLSSNDATTCEAAGEYLSGVHPLSKDDLMRGGTCAMTIVLKEPYPYDGDFAATGPETEINPGASVSSAIECAMGDGSFVRESRNDSEDYYWSERWWRGTPFNYAWNISGGGGGTVTIEVDMSDYRGSLPFDGVYANVTATGEVSGTVKAQWCPDMEWATVLY